MMNKFQLTFILLATCQHMSAASSPRNVPVGSDAYVGRWYLMNTTERIVNSFEINETCIVMDFLVDDESSDDDTFIIRQTSQHNLGMARHMSLGKAQLTDETGKFDASFFPSTQTDYDVIALGPVKDGLYQWSIATNSYKTSKDDRPKNTFNKVLFVLARDPNTYYQQYEEYVKEEVLYLDLMEFSMEIPQGDSCNYKPL
mmetsp:Transcript_32810/g.42144  ORF Transcript_32810/g.42144 Transcript_32810/m.42144 type:complete len:200 (-) Transcript_32810:198-797(-)|eukprot:CAMPEP_0114341160 /NCGR_PEP_ID=MMETSP0101-20121206/8859_1 /TAXON_ID=38822 ORGANISM="Pteridomonas danica, Strain PT" /NCGR_SAMPLE_ID=MMETSP0101 /ASSEMBLY_ACC=CAM_ASM_000211 /LENGTH=199 /DNA_ID=CAMNT_0001474665 /DNA_START=302 /DNA_END=901 /DNA_ORIENTATION=-